MPSTCRSGSCRASVADAERTGSMPPLWRHALSHSLWRVALQICAGLSHQTAPAALRRPAVSQIARRDERDVVRGTARCPSQIPLRSCTTSVQHRRQPDPRCDVRWAQKRLRGSEKICGPCRHPVAWRGSRLAAHPSPLGGAGPQVRRRSPDGLGLGGAGTLRGSDLPGSALVKWHEKIRLVTEI